MVIAINNVDAIKQCINGDSYKVLTKIQQGTALSTYKFYFIATKPGKMRLEIILFEVV